MFFSKVSGTGLACAHRGARSLAPENTILAARRAVECGARMWETDVHMTADDHLVIFHDETLGRTTDIASHPEFEPRRPWDVHGFTLEELRTLDAGTYFTRTDPFGTIAAGELSEQQQIRTRGQKIPTLAEALEFTRDNDLPMNLEIKDQTGHPGNDRIVRAVVDEIIKADAQHLILLSSFNHDYMIEAKSIAPGIPTAALQEENHPPDLINYLRSLNVAAYHPDKDITDPQLVRELVQADFTVNVWTVNDRTQAQSLAQAGACAIITDFPQDMINLV